LLLGSFLIISEVADFFGLLISTVRVM
jgi:hypothetical protein